MKVKKKKKKQCPWRVSLDLKHKWAKRQRKTVNIPAGQINKTQKCTRFKGLSHPCSRSTPRQSDDRLGYQYECTKQEVRAGCGLVMGTESDARVSLLLHFTKLTAHLFDLLFSWREFNIDAGSSSRSTRRDGGNRNSLAQNRSKSVSSFSIFH